MRKKTLAVLGGVALALTMTAAAVAVPGETTVTASYDDGNDTLTYSIDHEDPSIADVTNVTVPVTPNEDGKITHGSVMSALTASLGTEDHGQGCLVSTIARSGFGKDDTAADVTVTCHRGKPDDVEGLGNGDGGPPAHVLQKFQARGANGWQPGDGKPPWAGEDD